MSVAAMSISLPSGRVNSCRKRGKLSEHDRARVGDAERVQEVAHADAVEHRLRVRAGQLGQRAPLELAAVGRRAERVVVGDQRMHPVDDRELLGERVGHAEVVVRRPGDAAHDLARADAAERLLHALAGDPVPVRAHADLHGGMRDHGRRPLDRVDLREQRREDQAGVAEELLVVPAGVVLRQAVADRVVLEREQVHEHLQADPEARHPARVERWDRSGRGTVPSAPTWSFPPVPVRVIFATAGSVP